MRFKSSTRCLRIVGAAHPPSRICLGLDPGSEFAESVSAFVLVGTVGGRRMAPHRGNDFDRLFGGKGAGRSAERPAKSVLSSCGGPIATTLAPVSPV